LDTKDPQERAKLILDHAERMECKRYLTPNDIVDGSTNLNLAFVAQIFHQRWENKFTISCYIEVFRTFAGFLTLLSFLSQMVTLWNGYLFLFFFQLDRITCT
jgi:hypothetical protein